MGESPSQTTSVLHQRYCTPLPPKRTIMRNSALSAGRYSRYSGNSAHQCSRYIGTPSPVLQEKRCTCSVPSRSRVCRLQRRLHGRGRSPGSRIMLCYVIGAGCVWERKGACGVMLCYAGSMSGGSGLSQRGWVARPRAKTKGSSTSVKARRGSSRFVKARPRRPGALFDKPRACRLSCRLS